MTKQDCPCTNKINSIMIWSCVNVENYFDLFLRSLSEFDAKNGRITNFVTLLLYAKIVKIFIFGFDFCQKSYAFKRYYLAKANAYKGIVFFIFFAWNWLRPTRRPSRSDGHGPRHGRVWVSLDISSPSLCGSAENQLNSSFTIRNMVIWIKRVLQWLTL